MTHCHILSTEKTLHGGQYSGMSASGRAHLKKSQIEDNTQSAKRASITDKESEEAELLAVLFGGAVVSNKGGSSLSSGCSSSSSSSVPSTSSFTCVDVAGASVVSLELTGALVVLDEISSAESPDGSFVVLFACSFGCAPHPRI